jgi:hypothetical protein
MGCFGWEIRDRQIIVDLSLDFGLAEFGPGEIGESVPREFHGVKVKNKGERLRYYRKFLYEKGNIKGLEKEKARDFALRGVDRFLHLSRYFTDSGIIGSKMFVDRIYQEFKDHFSSKHEKKPKVIQEKQRGQVSTFDILEII